MRHLSGPETLGTHMLALCPLLLSLVQAPSQTGLSKEAATVVKHISVESLKEHLKYISSDELEGRATPSPGLDAAAKYIASSFKKAGLEPLGDDGYFQTSEWNSRRLNGLSGKVRNVIGVLRGSDPKLKDSYIFVTAHYDHLGKTKRDVPDQIYNGANDDGSGTVSVMELAKAMGSLKKHPKRSIVFMCLWGEELGLQGSRYYGQHPIVPVEKTIADVNLEQVGRTDDNEGPRVNAVSMTGEDYSDVGKIFEAAGKQVGVEVQRHPQFSDAFFGRSDNQALADLGVPAHTICTAFMYPDYHSPADTWDKIDYPNMAKVDALVAVGLLMIANSTTEPHWNADNPKAKPYLEAWNKLHPPKQ